MILIFLKHLDDLKGNGYMFFDELDQVQRADWAKKEKEKKERTKVRYAYELIYYS